MSDDLIRRSDAMLCIECARTPTAYGEEVRRKILDGFMRIPSADRPQGEYTIEDVAEILANAFGDECACNFNGIDEWLPFACKYTETGGCPQPEEKHGCWMQYLIQSGAKVKGADDGNK